MKIFYLTIWLFIVAISFTLFPGCQSAMNSFIETRLKQEAAAINNKVDKKIENDIRVDSASTSGKSIRFSYTMMMLTKEEMSPKVFYETMKPELIQYANSKDMGFYQKNKITIAYAYYYKNGTPLSTIIIKPEDYKNNKN
ncbi:MAG: hypothetical protein WC756_17225 [Taibaiella sp.]|jgi:hypothetical protein